VGRDADSVALGGAWADPRSRKPPFAPKRYAMLATTGNSLGREGAMTTSQFNEAATTRPSGNGPPDASAFSFLISQKTTIPANLCLFLRWVEFSGVGEDLDETTGNASEKAAW
jgi:hypothetical protein